ncbi:hypothetical protein [Kineothrix sp. MB12-C1]|uniref:hypothetical protein n=1 Tax=Kineothrix sp. MB12-C1 TaxID=3070215 RepID=UPI0027D34A49|nr:hypothetical protein [Kineothrix sp. MB12-C1]WMC93049.1 hypothetical protein RBB56_01815 [Kineothrix sp. MB12-C1]
MIDKKTIIHQLKDVIYNLLQITISDENTNLFSNKIDISPVNMVYLLLEMEKEFSITINDQFFDELPCITINHLADAICICTETNIS